MSARRRTVLRTIVLLASTAVVACEESTTVEFDGGPFSFRDGAATYSDASPSRSDGADKVPPPRSSLDEVLAVATGVARGRVTNLRLDAVMDEFRAAGIQWRIYYDLIELESSRALGTGRSPSMTVRLIPTKCEAYDDDGNLLPGRQLSTCTGRNEHNSPEVGEDLIALFMGAGEQPTLMFRMRIAPSGEVDVSGLADPPADRGEDDIWSAIELRWRELGRD